MSELILGWETAKAAGFGFTSRADPPAECEIATDNGDGHMIVLAGTGTGKSRSVAIPNLLHWDGLAIVLDIKGELAATTARYRREVLKQQVVVLDPWDITGLPADALNPLDGLNTGLSLADDSFALASQFGAPNGLLEDPFWQERGEALIAGLMAHIVTDEKDSSRRLDRLYRLLHADDTIYKLATLMDIERGIVSPFAREQIGSLLAIHERTRESILASAQSLVRILGGGLIQVATRATTFDPRAVTAGAPLTIYIAVPPANLRSHAAIIRLWMSFLLSLILERRAALEKPTLLLLDEVAQLGPMDQVRTAVTLTRAYGVRVALFLQSYSQLVSMYPTDHQTILENCGTVVTMGHTLRTVSSAIAEALGDLSADAMFGMAPGEAAVKTTHRETRIVKRLDYLTDPLFAGRFQPNPMFARRARVPGTGLER